MSVPRGVVNDPLYRLDVDVITPLERFIKRSRVKPTDGQIDYALTLIAKLRAALAASARTEDPA